MNEVNVKCAQSNFSGSRCVFLWFLLEVFDFFWFTQILFDQNGEYLEKKKIFPLPCRIDHTLIVELWKGAKFRFSSYFLILSDSDPNGNASILIFYGIYIHMENNNEIINEKLWVSIV